MTTLLIACILAAVWHGLAGVKRGAWEHPAQLARTALAWVAVVFAGLAGGAPLWRVLMGSASVFVFFGNALFQSAVNQSYNLPLIDADEPSAYDLLGFNVPKLFYASGRLVQYLLGMVLLFLTFAL